MRVYHVIRTSLQAGKLFFCTKLNVFVSGYCRVNNCRQLHSQLMKIATVSGLKNCGGCSSFALNKIRKIKSLNPRVIAWIKTHVTILVVYGDFKPYLAISMNYFISFANCCEKQSCSQTTQIQCLIIIATYVWCLFDMNRAKDHCIHVHVSSVTRSRRFASELQSNNCYT